MPLTAFRPALDHVDPGAAWCATAEDEAVFAAALRAAEEGATRWLGASFPGALEYYRLPDRLRDARSPALASALQPGRAAALAAVDHFATRTPIPTALRGGAAESPRRLARVAGFLRRRVAAWLERNAVETLYWDAVARWIPHPWIPVERVARPIERAARALGYGPIEISLEVKPPGGAAWLRERTVEAIAELRHHLDDGRPHPVELHCDDGAGPAPPRTVVAYGYEVGPGAVLTLHLYDPACGPEERRLTLDLDAPALQGRAEGDGAPPVAVRGLRCASWDAEKPPALGWTALLRLLGLEGLEWRIGRWRAARRARRAAR